MSVEGVVDATARVVALAPGIKRAYSTSSSGQDDVHPIPQDIPDSPVALVRHDRFELTAPGKPEILTHFIAVDVYVAATNAGAAEALLLPVISGIIAAFRTHVGLFGNATLAKLVGGGPADDVVINTKPFIVYPITVRAVELSVQEYTL